MTPDDVFIAVNVSPDLNPSAKIMVGLSDEVLATVGPTGSIELDFRPLGVSMFLTIIREADFDAVESKAQAIISETTLIPPQTVN
jgi:hypothetical protein